MEDVKTVHYATKDPIQNLRIRVTLNRLSFQRADAQVCASRLVGIITMLANYMISYSSMLTSCAQQVYGELVQQQAAADSFALPPTTHAATGQHALPPPPTNNDALLNSLRRRAQTDAAAAAALQQMLGHHRGGAQSAPILQVPQYGAHQQPPLPPLPPPLPALSPTSVSVPQQPYAASMTTRGAAPLTAPLSGIVPAPASPITARQAPVAADPFQAASAQQQQGVPLGEGLCAVCV
jgi:Meckel syndrome type 1 protein